MDMDSDSFKALAEPSGLAAPLRALWYDAKGNWEAAHDALQEASDQDSDWVHAYLHRKEGDEANARYWYRRAQQALPQHSLDEEWNQLVTHLLAKHRAS
jgi:hypothetical protein